MKCKNTCQVKNQFKIITYTSDPVTQTWSHETFDFRIEIIFKDLEKILDVNAPS